MHSSSFDAELPLLEGVRRTQSSETQVLSCSECSYAFTSPVFFHKHVKRSHKDLYCQMLGSGQIASAAAATFTRSVLSQKHGDADEPRSRGHHQQFTRTLNEPVEEVANPHRLTFTGKKIHNCKRCEKSFRSLWSLDRHQRVHTGEKPFPCQQCDKSFSQAQDLKRHEHLHGGDKPFHCKQCDKSFSEVTHLNTHQRIHTGEKPFYCKQCDKTFNELGSLRRHQRIHTGEKPYHCQPCGRRFNDVGNLKRHQHFHCANKRYISILLEKKPSTV